MTGIIMGNLKAVAIIDKTFDAASVSANTTAEQDVTIAGVKVGDLIVINPQSFNAGLGVVGVRAKAADTVAVTYVNATASPINAASMTIRFGIFRPETTGATSFAF